MSTCPEKGYASEQIEEVGRILLQRLQEARRVTGYVMCPVCQARFDGTHVIKCPHCRTLINHGFQPFEPSQLIQKSVFTECPLVFPDTKLRKKPKPPKKRRRPKKSGASTHLQLDFFAVFDMRAS